VPGGNKRRDERPSLPDAASEVRFVSHLLIISIKINHLFHTICETEKLDNSLLKICAAPLIPLHDCFSDTFQMV
jgi:hypothetical protein